VQTGKLPGYNAVFGIDSTDMFDSNSLRQTETRLSTQVNATENGFKLEPDSKPIRVLIEPLIRWKVNERLGPRNVSGPIIVTSDQVDVTETEQKQQFLVCFLEIDVSREALVAFRQRFCNMPIDGAIGRGTCLFYNGAETSKPYTAAAVSQMPPARREIHDRLTTQFFAAGPALFRVIYAKEPVSLEMSLFDVEKISGMSHTRANVPVAAQTAAAAAAAAVSVVAVTSVPTRKALKKKKARTVANEDNDGDDADNDDDSEDELLGSAKSKSVLVTKGKNKKGVTKTTIAAAAAAAAATSTTIVGKSTTDADRKAVKLPQGAVSIDTSAGEKIIDTESQQILEWCSSCLRNNSFHITLTVRGFVRAEHVFTSVAFQPNDFGRSFLIVPAHHLSRRPRLTALAKWRVSLTSDSTLLNSSVVLNQPSEIHKTSSTEMMDEASNGPSANSSRHATAPPRPPAVVQIWERHLLDKLEFIDLPRLSFGELIRVTRHRLKVLMIVTDFYESETPNSNHLYVRNYPGGYDAPVPQLYDGAPGLLRTATQSDYAAVALASICVIVKGDDDLIDWFLRAERFLISARNLQTDPLFHLQRVKQQIDISPEQPGNTPLSQLFRILRSELIEDLFEVDDGIWAPIEDVSDLVDETTAAPPVAPVDSDDVISLFGDDEDFADQIRLDESTATALQPPEK